MAQLLAIVYIDDKTDIEVQCQQKNHSRCTEYSDSAQQIQ
jgi:hypothetical protein